MKYLSVAGGMLMVAALGAGPASLDARMPPTERHLRRCREPELGAGEVGWGVGYLALREPAQRCQYEVGAVQDVGRRLLTAVELPCHGQDMRSRRR